MSRVLLKLSGESFADSESNFGIQPDTIERIASEITEACQKGIQIGVVVGGGNTAVEEGVLSQTSFCGEVGFGIWFSSTTAKFEISLSAEGCLH